MKAYKRGTTYWARIPRVGQVAVPRSLDCKDVTTAKGISAFLRFLKGRGERYLLDEMAEGRVQPLTAYLAWRDDKLPEFIAETKRASTDRDVFPYVARWYAEMARTDRPRRESRDKYQTMVHTLIHDRFPASDLNKHTIREWLSGRRTAAPKSVNKYRAALSSFCHFLVDQDVLAHNPVLDVKAARPSEPRSRYLEPVDVKRLLLALSDEARAYHALAACTALEVQALTRLRRGDIDVDRRTVLARATKTSTRSRTATVYKTWYFAWDLVLQYLHSRPMLPEALVFTIKPDRAFRELKRACVQVGIEDFHTHDWRHVWAVQAVRDGLAIQTVSHQLGHSNAAITLKVYAKFTPTAADFERVTSTNDTNSRTVNVSSGGGISAI